MMRSRNQQKLISNSTVALRSLCGWDWGQHGDVALFLLGAYRDQNEKMKTFKYVLRCHIHMYLPFSAIDSFDSLSVATNPKIESFVPTVPEFSQAVRKPFVKWATDVLPGIEQFSFYVLLFIVS